MPAPVIEKNRDVDSLNTLLRGELAAAATYRRALLKLPTSSNVSLYQDCGRSHADRASLLASEVQRRGGLAESSSGIWGAFAQAFESGAQLFGETAAIFALAEGENHGKGEYLDVLTQLDAEAHELIARRLLPEQLRTHGLIQALKVHSS